MLIKNHAMMTAHLSSFSPSHENEIFCYESIDYFSLYYYDTILYNNERHRETKIRITRCTSVHRYLRSHTHQHTFGHNLSLPSLTQTWSGIIILKTRDGWGTDSKGRREAEIKGSRRQRYFCYLTACTLWRRELRNERLTSRDRCLCRPTLTSSSSCFAFFVTHPLTTLS